LLLHDLPESAVLHPAPTVRVVMPECNMRKRSALVFGILMVSVLSLTVCSGNSRNQSEPTTAPASSSVTTVTPSLFSTTTSTLPELPASIPLSAARIRDLAGLDGLHEAWQAGPDLILAVGSKPGDHFDSAEWWASLERLNGAWTQTRTQILTNGLGPEQRCYFGSDPNFFAFSAEDPAAPSVVPGGFAGVINCLIGGTNGVSVSFVLAVVDGQPQVVFYASCGVMNASGYNGQLSLYTSGPKPRAVFAGQPQPSFVFRWDPTAKRFVLDDWAVVLGPAFDRFCEHADNWTGPK
jgi:hypothetical protein